MDLRPWCNLPEGIVELIINKLHFPDQIRGLAVCKDWRESKDYVRCSGCLPWVISSQRAFDIDIDTDGDGDDDAFIYIGHGNVDGVIDIEGDGDIEDDGAFDIGDSSSDIDGYGSDGALDIDGDGAFDIGDGAFDIGDHAFGDGVFDIRGNAFYVDGDGDGDGDGSDGAFDVDEDGAFDFDEDGAFYGDGSDGESGVHSSVRELFDPYSRKVNQVSNPIIMDSNGCYIPLAAKNGWVWALFVCNYSSKVFLHNPFTNEIRSVYPFPKMKIDLLHAAIKGDPTSLEFEIFTLRICADELHVDVVKRDSYSSDSIVQKLSERYDFIYDALHINGYIYCLFRDGTLYRYGLENRSWDLLTSGFPEPYESCYYMLGDWLLEIKDNLIMVRMDIEIETHKWMIFRFDWSKMSWVVETSLKSCAIYISDFLAFSTPLKSSSGEILEDCRLFHHEDRGIKCYSLSEAGGVEIQSEEYSWITRSSRYQLSFIERPYIGI